jgi:hypothetical protein
MNLTTALRIVASLAQRNATTPEDFEAINLVLQMVGSVQHAMRKVGPIESDISNPRT